jgi:hypothetical protein
MIDIDLVYLWVNGNDPKWIAKREALLGESSFSNTQENCKGRYVDNQEMKYSLRSVEKYAPWVRKIFIVTDNQTPDWLDTSNPKIQIVDHTEILPAESLPCFNSVVIEHHLHKIPGLAEHFLYANDDMYINKQVTPEAFFGKDNLPLIRINRRPFRKWFYKFKLGLLRKELKNYANAVHNAALLVEKNYGTYYNCKAHHNIDAYLKSSFAQTREMFDKEIRATLTNHQRSSNDIQRCLYSFVALAEKQGHLLYVKERTSLRLLIHNNRKYKEYERHNPMFFCLNDSEYASDDDRRRATAFVAKLFPEKSQFEK